MKDIIYFLFHLLTTIAKLIQPGGSRAVIAENLLLKQRLIIHRRAHQRAPNLTTRDRTVLGFLSLFLNPLRLGRSAIIIKPSTLLRFHNALNGYGSFEPRSGLCYHSRSATGFLVTHNSNTYYVRWPAAPRH